MMASLQQENKEQQNNNNNNTKQVTIHTREDSDSELQNLFDFSLNKGGQRSLYVPLRMRNLPASFWQPPTHGSKSPSVHSRENSLDNSLGTFSPGPGASPQPAPGGVGLAHHNRANSCPATLEQTLAVAQQQNHNLQNLHLRQQSYDVGGGDDMGPLPPGWEMAKAPNGQLYYMNHITKTTQWEDPRKQIQQQMVNQMNGTASPRSSAVVSPVPNGQGGLEMGPLPSGWEQSVTQEGEVYFIHHMTKRTTWYDPRIPMNVQQVPHKQGVSQENALSQAQRLQQERRLRRLENEKRVIQQKQAALSQIMAFKQDRDNVQQSITQTQEMMMRHSLSDPGTKLDPFNQNGEQHNRQESTDSGLGMGSNFNLGIISEDVGMESMETDLDTTLTESNQPHQVALAAAASQQQQQAGAPQQQPMEQPQQQQGAVQQPRPGGQNSMDTEELIPTLPELGEELSRDFMSSIFTNNTSVENELTWL